MSTTNEATTAMMTKRKKPINKRRVAFIICCCIFPILNFLVFYVYVNFSSFTMAFTNKSGAVSLDNFKRFYEELADPNSVLRLAFRNTFLTFGLNLVAFPLRVMVSYFLYKKIPGAKIYRVLFFLPTIIFAVALTMIFQRMVSVNGIIAKTVQDIFNLEVTPVLLADSRFANATVLINMLWMGFPGDLIIWGGAFARIPEDAIESARIDGVNWWQEFTKIVVPLVWPTLALSMVLSICGIFGSTASVFLLTKGDYGTMTFASWITLQLVTMSGNRYTSNALNYMSAVGLTITVIAVVMSKFIRKWTDKVFSNVEY